MDNSIGAWTGPRHRHPLVEADPQRRLLPALVATFGWYMLPAFLLLLWKLFFSRAASAAVPSLSVGLTLLAIVLGLLLTVPLRRVTYGWQPLTVGFAAAVISAGATSVVFGS
ncbi:hypothetical protein [Longispora albida]|uniref:hypothetical protein n=1 Tax=Longispora albida TaxID=203523 RepID=UPI0003781CCC|nr:hypothetical protein [Longispora albida]